MDALFIECLLSAAAVQSLANRDGYWSTSKVSEHLCWSPTFCTRSTEHAVANLFINHGRRLMVFRDSWHAVSKYTT